MRLSCSASMVALIVRWSDPALYLPGGDERAGARTGVSLRGPEVGVEQALQPKCNALSVFARIISCTSPTVFREGGFRFFFFSREEPRMHVHVQNQNGEAKFWLEPAIELATDVGLSRREIAEALRLIREHENDIHLAWRRHFCG